MSEKLTGMRIQASGRSALPIALVLATAACGIASPGEARPDDGEVAGDPCPAPGAGVALGGRPGTGSDSRSTPVRRLVLMGGGREDDTASTRFVEAAAGGDVVILRASGSVTSYPSYFAGTLSPKPPPASVVTLLTSPPSAAAEPAFLCWLARAEAVWIAGGDQWAYLGEWPSPVHAALAAVATRGGAVGGTSAGAMALGEAAFDARHGSVTSSAALADPLAAPVSLSYPSFAQPELAATLVDTHFTEREREGRLLAFLARFISDRALPEVRAVGLDEGVALVVEGGRFRVYAPASGSAWFYRLAQPPAMAAGEPLTLSGVLRRRAPHGTEGAWPPAWDGAGLDVLDVERGEVRVSSAGGDDPARSRSGPYSSARGR